ncbi:MAG TPA: M24 family metallopeptidase [Acidimicrobiia bacterium]|nr:M24 family metallopeptidase [Acidimicrobiia bacterium]
MDAGGGDQRAARRAQVRGLLGELALGAIRLGRPENFAWYTGGADNRVDHASTTGVAEIVVTADGEYVVTNNIEALRMREEQTPGVEIVEYDWFAGPGDVLGKLAGGGAVGADSADPAARDISADVAPLRYQLDDDAIARYRLVAADAVRAVDEACARLTPAMTETEAAGAVVGACRAAGLFVPAHMVGGAARLPRYRHPIPHGAPLGARALVVVCAERGGLYANLSRFVHFQPPDAELAAKLEACQGILVQLRQATRPGRTLADLFDDCRRFYADAGWADGWRHHHQGGLTGYRSREVIAGPGVDLEIAVGQAFAWNPSLPGAKAEETFVLTAAGPEVLCP